MIFCDLQLLRCLTSDQADLSLRFVALLMRPTPGTDRKWAMRGVTHAAHRRSGDQLAVVEKRVVDATGIAELALVEDPHRAQRRMSSFRVLISALYGGAAAVSLTAAVLTFVRM